MIIFKLECINEDGVFEVNGYFFKLQKAEEIKKELDNSKRNKEYGIIQHIIPIEVI